MKLLAWMIIIVISVAILVSIHVSRKSEDEIDRFLAGFSIFAISLLTLAGALLWAVKTVIAGG